jgi:hypothetical protein
MMMMMMKEPKIVAALATMAATMTVTPAWLLRSSAAESQAPTGGRS